MSEDYIDISELAVKPALISFMIDDEATVEKFGKPVKMYTLDRQPIESYFKLVSQFSDEGDVTNSGELVKMLSEMLLDKKGDKLFVDGKSIPKQLIGPAINNIVKILGN